MKFSLKLGPQKPLDRELARACLVANLCFPGSGSLLAGRGVGYSQVALVGLALVLQMFFLGWLIKLWATTREFPFPAAWADGIPRQAIFMMALALSTIAMFALAWFWALLTSLIISSEVKRRDAGAKAKPPALDPVAGPKQ
jgi:hypothetical protein